MVNGNETDHTPVTENQNSRNTGGNQPRVGHRIVSSNYLLTDNEKMEDFCKSVFDQIVSDDFFTSVWTSPWIQSGSVSQVTRVYKHKRKPDYYLVEPGYRLVIMLVKLNVMKVFAQKINFRMSLTMRLLFSWKSSSIRTNWSTLFYINSEQ